MPKSWLDHPGKVALVGAFIVLMGQLGATIFPILLGPDLSDYDLVCNPMYINISIDESHTIFINKEPIGTGPYGGLDGLISTIDAISLHKIYNYNREIFLYVDSPPGISVSLSNPIIKTGEPVNMRIGINLTHMLKYSSSPMTQTQDSEMYPIKICGIGADGKRRNCTVIIGIGLIRPNRLSVGDGTDSLRSKLRYKYLNDPTGLFFYQR
jgi:hypothetical protein